MHDAVISHRSIAPLSKPPTPMPTAISRLAGTLSLAVTFLAMVGDRSFDSGAMARVEGSVASVVAWLVCTTPALMVAAFAIVQVLPGGRAIAPIPSSPAYDAWPLAFVGLITVPTAASRAAIPSTAFVAAPIFSTATLVALVVCLIVRVVQIRRL